MSLYLHQQRNGFVVIGPGLRRRLWVETSGRMTRYDCRIVGISREDVLSALLVGVLDHAEQRPRLIDTINGP